MNRHERTLLLIGSALIICMAALRISHHLSASQAQVLVLLGSLFAVSAYARYSKRLKAENHALRTHNEDFNSPPR